LSVKLRFVGRGHQLDLGVRALAVYDGHGLGRVTARNPNIEAVNVALGSPDTRAGQSWQSRRETTPTKIEFGDPVALAKVVRDAVERPRPVAAGSRVSPAEQELCRKARPMLVAAQQRDGIEE
jgi:RNA polymerase-interacting CarD/CdnL/TRCF family regulator